MENKTLVVAGLIAMAVGGILLARKAEAAPPEEELPPPTYACSYCTAEFNTVDELLAHIALVHPAQPPQVTYVCPICGVHFSSMGELNAHIVAVHPPVVAVPFTFSTPTVNVFTDKLAPAWRVAETSVKLTNPHNTTVTRLIYACWASESKPNDWHCNRSWNGGIEYYELTLSPGGSRTLVSPAYYYDEYGEEHSNSPGMGYSAGVPKKYYFSFCDDLGNRSPRVLA